MPSNREAYFYALKLDIPKAIIDFALKEVNGFDNFQLTKYFDDEVKDYPLFLNAIKRYQSGEMIEYVFEKTYFLSNPFYVNKNVLIPRQETEDLVIRTISLINEMFSNKKLIIADVCTGSGCIGISIAKKLPNNKYFFTDISKEALRVAKKNAANLLDGVDVKVLEGNMLEPLKDKKVDVIVCNPPYIEDISSIDERTFKQEPHLALLASPSTFFYEEVLKNYGEIVNNESLLAFEIGEDMEESLKSSIEKYCSNCEYSFEKDLYGKTRFLFIKTIV